MAKSGLIRTAYDNWAAYYDLIEGNRAPFIDYYRTLVGDDTRSLLDLACGTGTITAALAQDLIRREPGARVVGVDESSAMLEVARGREPRIDWVLGDMRSPPVTG